MNNQLFEEWTKKAAALCAFLVFLSLTLYILGNYQSFLDATQERLLRFEKIAAMILAVCLGFLSFGFLREKNKPLPIRILFFLLTFILSVLAFSLSVAVTGILTWTSTPG
ncbi:MAG: hypothetical protein JW760_02770 [Spirochaetales bacterium]|nr:hypothetical protein [Spirochaetales bacterium]